MSERGLPPPLPETAAVELETLMRQALRDFARQHAELVRVACNLTPDVTDLEAVVACSFLGHTLERIRQERGRSAAEELVTTLLEGLQAAALRQALHRSTLQ